MAINFKRFFKRLEDINNLKNKSFEKININRIALTLEDKITRDKIIKWMKNLNLTIKIDNIGNIFGFYNFKKNTKIKNRSINNIKRVTYKSIFVYKLR